MNPCVCPTKAATTIANTTLPAISAKTPKCLYTTKTNKGSQKKSPNKKEKKVRYGGATTNGVRRKQDGRHLIYYKGTFDRPVEPGDLQK